MVTVVQNVTRDMREISCYADNGYGTPMQASRTITISREYWEPQASMGLLPRSIKSSDFSSVDYFVHIVLC